MTCSFNREHMPNDSNVKRLSGSSSPRCLAGSRPHPTQWCATLIASTSVHLSAAASASPVNLPSCQCLQVGSLRLSRRADVLVELLTLLAHHRARRISAVLIDFAGAAELSAARAQPQSTAFALCHRSERPAGFTSNFSFCRLTAGAGLAPSRCFAMWPTIGALLLAPLPKVRFPASLAE